MKREDTLSRLSTTLRWAALRLARPYLRNRYLEKGKWRLLQSLNPSPGIESDWSALGHRVTQMSGGGWITCELVYAADRALYLTGEYETDKSRLLERVLSRKWRFVDVGANVGKYTVAAAKRAAEVIAVEPNPVSLAHLRNNLALNRFENVRVLACGLSDRESVASLHVAGIDIGGATVLEDRPFTDAVAIDVVSGDSVVSPSDALYTYLKIDVEGLELRVLRGFSKLIETRRVLVQVEITDDWLRVDGGSAAALFELMSSFGYAPFEVVHRTVLRRTVDVRRIVAPLDRFQYDVVFAPVGGTSEFWSWVAMSQR